MSQKPLYYSDYLALDKILDAQNPVSSTLSQTVHDETLFISVHQVFELWFQQILTELDSLIGLFTEEEARDPALTLIVSRLHRITEIQRVLIQQIEVLKTMTPMDFLEFRDLLTPASGFQSWQFRLIENRMGIIRHSNSTYLNSMQEAHRERIKQAETQNNLFNCVEQWLGAFPIEEHVSGDFWVQYQQSVNAMLSSDEKIICENPLLTENNRESQLRQLNDTREYFQAIFDEEAHAKLKEDQQLRLSFKALRTGVFIFLYREQSRLYKPFQLLSYLIDMDELFANWRQQHVLLVQRMVGTKIGTGGSAGLGYLRSTIERSKIFNDVANISILLVPRSKLPVGVIPG